MAKKRTLKQIFDIFIFGLIVLSLFSPLVSLVPVAAADVTLVVDTTIDSNASAYRKCTTTANDCSLRGAISLANADLGNAYVIELQDETYTLTIAGGDEDANATGDLDLYRNITLIGQGKDKTVISGNSIDRVLDVKSGAVVTLEDLAIKHGLTANVTRNGGGVYNEGTMTIDSVGFSLNHTYDGADGANGTSASYSTKEGKNGESGGAGGAIYNANMMTIRDSYFQLNSTGSGGKGGNGSKFETAPGNGGNGGNGGAGGAIYNGGSLTISTSTFVNNSTGDGGKGGLPGLTQGFGSFGSSGHGGDGGTIYDAGSSLVVETCYFTQNKTGTGADGNNLMTSSQTYRTPSGGGRGGNGSGIYQQSSGLVVTYSTFYDNQTGVGGVGGSGGNFTNISGTITVGNASDGAKGRGAVTVSADTVTLQATLFSDNDVDGDVVGSITTSGYNLIGNGDRITAGLVASDQVGTAAAPIVAGITFNSFDIIGNKQNFVFDSTSRALNQIPAGEVGCGTSVTTDYNGNARPKGLCEIGVLEDRTGVPDLMLEKTNDVSGEAIVKSAFEWTFAVENVGEEDAIFETGEVIFADNLPIGAVYALKSVSNFNHITNSDKIYCVVYKDLSETQLQCSAKDTVGIGYKVADGDLGSFEVVLEVIPQSTAGLASASCVVDGDDVVLETNETNNTCADSVSVFEGTEIAIKGSGSAIVDGDTSASSSDGTDFGDVSSSGGTAESTFTIENSGDKPLNLTTDPRVVISGADASAFSVTTDAAAVINANSSTTFEIEFAPTSAGIKNALVTVANDDLDEGTYTFAIQGTGAEAPEVSFGTMTYPSLNATLANGITHLAVEFDSDVKGLGDADSANNVNNYLLFASGPNGVFDTVSCAGGVVTDDVNIPIFSAFYDDHDENGPYVVSLTVNNDVPLSGGDYRLLVCGTTSIHNNAGIELGDGSDAVLDFNVVRRGNGASASGGTGLDSDEEMMPGTGLPMVEGIVTLPKQPETAVYAKTEYVLSIPKLDVKMPIVGVPKTMTGWDVTWLGEKAGYLAESAYPTQAGNTVLTGHVWDNLNHAGPFADLKNLAYGDEILITAAGGVYVYEVRESQVIAPNDLDAVFQEETFDWVTLLTCENYQEGLGTYAARRIVRAVLVEVR